MRGKLVAASVALLAAVAGALVFFFADDGAPHRTRTATPQPQTNAPVVREGGPGGAAASEDPAGLAVSVTVRDASGAPAADAELELAGVESRVLSSDPEGRARIAGLSPGYYNLLARKGRATAAVDFQLTQDTELEAMLLAPAVTVRGRVFDTTREPIAGAVVEAVRGWEAANGGMAGTFRALTEPESVLARARTGADGSYELLVPAGANAALRAWAEGFAQDGRAARVYAEDATGADFWLARGATLAGRVVDEQGAPVSGVRLLVGALGRQFQKAETSTGSDGAFEMSVAPAPGVDFVARAPGFAVRTGLAELPARHLSIVLDRGVSLRLRTVIEESPSEPAPGVTVTAGSATGETGSDGRLVLEHLPSDPAAGFGDRGLMLWGRGYLPKAVELTAEPVDGWIDLGDVAVSVGGVVRGRVLDAVTGGPVVGARVRASGGEDHETAFLPSEPAVSDEDGAFVLAGVPLGAATLLADHPDYVPNVDDPMGMMGGPGGEPLFAAGEREAQRDVVMAPAATVHGSVVDPDGKPVPGATVTVRGFRFALFYLMMGRRAPETTTNAAGEFSLGGLPGDQPVPVIAAHPDYGNSDVVWATPGGERADLALAPPALLHGVVVDETGEPVAGVFVRAEWREEDSGAFSQAGPVFTDGEGRWNLRILPGGDFEVAFDREGYKKKTVPAAVAPGSRVLDLGRTVLERGLGIEGVVVDEKGEPRRVHVSLRAGAWNENADGRPWVSAQADAEGRFAAFGLEDDVYVVYVDGDFWVEDPRNAPARRPRRGPHRVKVRAGDRDVRIVVREAGALSGRILDRGEPVAGADITVRAAGGHVARATSAADGSFRLSPLPPHETLDVTVEHHAYPSLTVQGLRAGARDFTLDPGARVSGRVVDERGAPVAGALVVVRFPPPEGEGAGRAKRKSAGFGASERTVSIEGPGERGFATGPDGRFDIGGLPRNVPLSVALEAAELGYLPTEPVAVEPDSGSTRLVARRGMTIQGIVRDADGKPVPLARVTAVDAQGEVAGEATQAKGPEGFTIRGLRDGVYTLRVLTPKMRVPRPVTTRPGEPADREEAVERAGVAAGATGVEIRVP